MPPERHFPLQATLNAQTVDMDLYALPPEDFIAARDAAAKEDKNLKVLRKPSVSAWVVNTLIRQQRQLLDDVLGLGAELAEAQGSGDASAIRELTQQRHQLVEAVTEKALQLVERAVTPQVRTEVAATIEAAMADPASAAAVQTGQLVRALSYAGFGGVDLEGAVADLPPTTLGRSSTSSTREPAATTPADRARIKRIEKFEAAALDAQGALDDAVRHAERLNVPLESAEQAEAKASEDLQDNEQRVDAARHALAEAEKVLHATRARRTKAVKDAEDLRSRAERATRAVAEAQAQSEAARKQLDDARRNHPD